LAGAATVPPPGAEQRCPKPWLLLRRRSPCNGGLLHCLIALLSIHQACGLALTCAMLPAPGAEAEAGADQREALDHGRGLAARLRWSVGAEVVAAVGEQEVVRLDQVVSRDVLRQVGRAGGGVGQAGWDRQVGGQWRGFEASGASGVPAPPACPNATLPCALGVWQPAPQSVGQRRLPPPCPAG
jgi:hypothetical protein